MSQTFNPTSATGLAYSQGIAWARAPAPTTTAKQLPAGPSCQPCPACGGLNCLCRPRFFPGQCLTEDDLNRLTQYIVAKNQLHNRYLVGTGVVCGLDVSCSPCGNNLSVSAGYAIDTCGNDIIVCGDDSVDICALINACTPASSSNCAPYKDTSACRDMEQEWILAISYAESPSRGVTALTGSAQCSCGSGSGGGCGCGSQKPAFSCCGVPAGNSTTAPSTKLPRRGAPPTCEPTLTCETYRYEVFQAPPAPARPTLFGGEMLAQIKCCVDNLFGSLPALPVPAKGEKSVSQTATSAYLCNLRLALIDHARANGGSKCTVLDRLNTIRTPVSGQDDAGRADFGLAADNARLELAAVMIELLVDCVCTAALPPCPQPGDPRVPLASVKVRASDCSIISICDWTPLRKNVVTTKTLGYWLGWLPFVPLLREFMQDLCCRALRLPEQLRGGRDFLVGAKVEQDATGAKAAEARTADVLNTTNATDPNTPASLPLSFAARDYNAGNPLLEAIFANIAGGQKSITAATLLQALAAPPDASATETQLAAGPHAQILAEIARPLLNAFSPLLSAGTKPAADDQTLVAMRAELDGLKTTVAQQQAALDALRNASPPAAGT